MRRALAVLLLALLAGCATQPEGPLSGSGSVVGDPSSPRNRARIHTELGMLYYLRGNMRVALEELRTAVAADSSYAPGHGSLGLAYMELGENELADRSFRRGLELAPEDPDINHNYGWFLCQVGRVGESAPFFKRALDNPLYPTPARTHAAQGSCALRAGELARADDSLQRALRIEPDMAIALLRLAELRYRQARYDAARRTLQRHAAVAQPTAESLWLGLRIERHLGVRAAELSYANQLRRRFPDSPETLKLQRGEYE